MSISLNATAMRHVDEYTINEAGIPGPVLMERAALKVAEHVLREDSSFICVVYGAGNNGGDGLAAARILALAGCNVTAVPASSNVRERMSELCALEKRTAEKCGVVFADTCELKGILTAHPGTVVIDAIFGIGLSRAPEGEYAETIRLINSLPLRVYSIDIPSGGFSDTGYVPGEAVDAYATVTFGFIKTGMLMYPLAEKCGRILVEDAGFALGERDGLTGLETKGLLDRGGRAVTYFKRNSDPMLPQRRPDSNKGTYGKVLFIGGAGGFAGAGYLSSSSAYFTGAGLVRALTGADAVRVINMKMPEVMTGILFRGDEFDAELLDTAIEWADVVLAGPGMGKTGAARAVLDRVLGCGKQLVLDADALNILAEDCENEIAGQEADTAHRRAVLFRRIKSPAIFTPHIGELSRLTGISTDTLKKRIFDTAAEYTAGTEHVFVCKDARTVVAADGRLHININGNSGLSTGGSGDVLAGVIAGLCACGLEPFEAGRTGTFVHGLAADRIADRICEDALVAGMLPEEIPECISSMRGLIKRRKSERSSAVTVRH